MKIQLEKKLLFVFDKMIAKSLIHSEPIQIWIHTHEKISFFVVSEVVVFLKCQMDIAENQSLKYTYNGKIGYSVVIL